MKLTILFSGRKFNIVCEEDTYDCLSKMVAQEVNIPIDWQTLIFKGKSLQFGSLSGQGLGDNAKVMLIGQQTEKQSTQSEASTERAAIDAVEKSIRDLEIQLDQLREEFSDCAKGFVPPDLRQLFSRAFAKRLASLTCECDRCRARLAVLSRSAGVSRDGADRCRRLVDALDSLTVSADGILADLMAMSSVEYDAFSAD